MCLVLLIAIKSYDMSIYTDYLKLKAGLLTDMHK
jgi:hypothetical protein